MKKAKRSRISRVQRLISGTTLNLNGSFKDQINSVVSHSLDLERINEINLT